MCMIEYEYISPPLQAPNRKLSEAIAVVRLKHGSPEIQALKFGWMGGGGLKFGFMEREAWCFVCYLFDGRWVISIRYLSFTPPFPFLFGFVCYQPSCVVKQSWFWADLFHKFSNFTPPIGMAAQTGGAAILSDKSRQGSLGISFQSKVCGVLHSVTGEKLNRFSLGNHIANRSRLILTT